MMPSMKYEPELRRMLVVTEVVLTMAAAGILAVILWLVW